jgi:Uma2 family endonuclease
MSTADTSTLAGMSAPIVVASHGRLFTVADLAALPTDLPSGPVNYELNNGRLEIMSPTGRKHGKSQAKITGHLMYLGELKGHGEVMTEVGVILWRNPDRVVGPDVAFFSNSRLPTKDSPEGYIETIPDLVVEVRSKNDSHTEVEQKTKDYLQAGVQVVWVVDNNARTITVSGSNNTVTVLRENDVLRAEEIVPGFEVPVKDIFSS